MRKQWSAEAVIDAAGTDGYHRVNFGQRTWRHGASYDIDDPFLCSRLARAAWLRASRGRSRIRSRATASSAGWQHTRGGPKTDPIGRSAASC